MNSTESALGAIPVSANQTQFKVWAPNAKRLVVELIERSGEKENVVATHELKLDSSGIFDGTAENCPAGSLYRFKLDDRPSRPDPRTRFQPFGVHGPSQVIDPAAYTWKDSSWKGIGKRDLVIYELHIGSFTEEGTYAAAIEKLNLLKELGITAIELLPLAQCPGKWNWGYDGVNYFAPSNNFGSPDELKAFVDACHTNGFAVIIDVVYNHVGPEGNYLSEFGPYRSTKFGTPWGDAFAFDLAPVRQFVIDNILFWVEEYHFDGLRLDAVHYMFDDSELDILDEIKQTFGEFSKTVGWQTHLIGESNIYDPELIGDLPEGKHNFDAIWSDCLMHSIYKAGRPDLRLTNRHYQESDILETIEHAYVFSAPKAIRVTGKIRAKHHPDGDREYINSLIMALQTHDSVGNHPQGKRLHQLTSVDFQKAAAPLILLYPSIPMIFMGEEWATDAPFPFFADFEDQGLRKAVDKGRQEEYPHHDWVGSPLPSDPAAFLNSRSTIDQLNQEMFDWYRNLLRLRKLGLKDGWLKVENWSTHSDPKTQVYRMIYQHSLGDRDDASDSKRRERLNICCRLAREKVEPIPIEELNNSRPPKEVFFNSKPGEDSLTHEHCLIWLG